MSKDLIKQVRDLLAEGGGRAEARSLSDDEIHRQLRQADADLRGQAEGDDGGKVSSGPGPSLFPGMTDAEVIRRYRGAEKRLKLQREGPPPEPPMLHCEECGVRTPHGPGGEGHCLLCFEVERVEARIAHARLHLDATLAPRVRREQEAELRDAQRELREAQAQKAVYSARNRRKDRRGRVDGSANAGGGLLDALGEA